jgi:streptogramin lyase
VRGRAFNHASRGLLALVICALVSLLIAGPASAGAPTATEFPLGPGVDPSNITAGPDGNLWFTADNEGSPRIDRISPAGKVTEFGVGLDAGDFPGAITSGPDGNLWFLEDSGKIGRITPAGVISQFPVGSGFDITAGPDGNLWFTPDTQNGINRITSSGSVSTFTSGISSATAGITAGPDGNLWFTEPYSEMVGRITPTGAVSEFSTSPRSPAEITAGPDGNLWFAEDLGVIGRITPAGTVTQFPIPEGNTNSGHITGGPDGNVWFTVDEAGGGSPSIGRITPSGDVSLYKDGVKPFSRPADITAGPDGNLWFTEPFGNAIGRIPTSGPDPDDLTLALKAKAKQDIAKLKVVATCSTGCSLDATATGRAGTTRLKSKRVSARGRADHQTTLKFEFAKPSLRHAKGEKGKVRIKVQAATDYASVKKSVKVKLD